MKALKELVYLITRHKRKQIEVLGYNEDATSRYEIFYGLIESGRLETDEDAARYFFGPDKDHKFTQYRNLRNKLFKRLLNTFFFIDLKKPEFNSAQAAAHNCAKYAAAMRMLAARGARNSAAEVAHKTIKPALKYELTEIVLDVARYLRYYYAFITPDEPKRNHYENLIAEHLSILEMTVKAEKMYYDLIGPYRRSKANNRQVHQKAKTYIEELESWLEGLDAYGPSLHYFLIAYIEKGSIHDHEGTIKVCQEAIAFLKDRPATRKSMLTAFYHPLVVSYTLLRQFDHAESAMAEAEVLTNPGTHNWFKGMELNLILQFYQKKYDSAYEIFKEATAHPQYSHLPQTESESWKIYEGCIQLLIETSKVNCAENANTEQKFRLAKFLNEICEFTKDKQGMNITILTIHVLFLLHRKKYDQSYDRMLALNKYADRHLKNNEGTIRSYCFIKALAQIPKANFKAGESDQKATSWLTKMKKHPLQLSDTPYEIEPIPFEHMWELALEALD